MVAVIHSSSSLRNALNYNEQKVKEGAAVCLAAVHYPKDTEDLNFYQKLKRLEKLTALNVRTKVNSVHVSLNFDPSEKLSEEQLRKIADAYLQKIGFGEQPYLLYQHHDSGHPHVHILTTNIQPDGKRIELHNLGKNQSEKARREIEKQFNLIPAEEHKRKLAFELKPVNVQKVQYGKSAAKRAMTNVLEAVLKDYKYTSLPELNTVLNQYNVTADRGSENSRIYKNNGLVYRIMNEHGEKVGVPIKASDFYNKPTLKFLAERFALNETSRQPHKARVKNAVNLALLGQKNISVQALIKALKKEGIHTVLRQNTDGVIYGITYVDHRSKCVFNGSTLGKNYSAKAILERCISEEKTAVKKEAENQKPLQQQSHSEAAFPKSGQQAEQAYQASSRESILNILTQPEYVSNYLPYQLKRKDRRKKRKHISNNQ